ncbi:MAG: hypothetical protein AABX77_03605 [Nanoarchaeota archaeon]
MAKKRRVLKKGHIVYTKKGSFVIKLAKELARELKPFCKKIKIAGSLRRHEQNPDDIDIVLIPKNKEKIKDFLIKKGNYIQGGEQQATFKIRGIKVELYYTIPKEFGATLLAYSSNKGPTIGLRVVAKKEGFKLSRHGLFKEGKKEKFIAGKTEREIYKALGRSYKSPEKR